MPQRGSLPWVLLAAAIGIAFASLLYAIGDVYITAITTQPTWTENTSTYAGQGQAYMNTEWNHTLIPIILGIAMATLIASRRP